jgi:hypothetical protein
MASSRLAVVIPVPFLLYVLRHRNFFVFDPLHNGFILFSFFPDTWFHVTGSFVPISDGAAIAQWYSTGLLTGWPGVRVPAWAENFSHPHVQTGSGAHPASYPMGNSGSFPGSKAAGTWSWPFTSTYCWAQECVELHLHSLTRWKTISFWRRILYHMSCSQSTCSYPATGTYMKLQIDEASLIQNILTSPWARLNQCFRLIYFDHP